MNTYVGSQLTQIRDVNISVAGLECSGKTSIINRLVRGEDVQTFSTYGVNQELLFAKGMVLGITDLGGREPIRKTLWKSFISKSDALIYVTDATKPSKLEESQRWFIQSLKWVKPNSPVLVLINKKDKEISQEEINRIIKKFSLKRENKLITCLITSSITGENINETIDWLASSIIQQLILDKISVELFVSYIKTNEGIVEARIRTPVSDIGNEALFPIIRYKFAEKGETNLEYMRYDKRQFVMAADEEISCWLVTEKNDRIKSMNLLMKLLVEFVKEIHGLKKEKKEGLTEADLSTFLITNLIDNQTFWSKTEQPMFEISFVQE